MYIGVTNNIKKRIHEHKNKLVKGFTQRYNLDKRVYFEEYQYINNAIKREKQLKNWNRAWKIELIEAKNKKWQDLASDWFDEQEAV